MWSILSRLFPRDPLPLISIVGLDAAGKSTLMYKLASSEVVTTIPVIGMAIETAKIQTRSPGGKKLSFTAKATDVGGCSKVYPIVRRLMIEDVSALVWVVDGSDRDRIVEGPEELQYLLPKLGVDDTDVFPSLPILVLINKADLPDGESLGKIYSRFDYLLYGRKFAYFRTTITNLDLASSGLPEAFVWLADAIASTSKPIDEKIMTSEVKKPVEKVLSDMRSPSALSNRLEEWLVRAEKENSAEQLLQQLYALDLPNWDHYTHLHLAYILLLKFGRREGKDKIFDGFKNYIDNSGKIHGKSFHTTMTYFWVQMVHTGIANMGLNENTHTLQEKDKDQSRLDDFARFLMVNPFIVDGQLWSDYYTKETLMSPEAKAGFVLPDVKPLPDIVSRDTVTSVK